MNGVYLASLFAAAAGIAALDRRWRLAVWGRPGATCVTVIAALAVFVTWDLVAIGFGFYRIGASDALLGVNVRPRLPLEEIGFIMFFGYATVVVFAMARRFVGPKPTTEPSRPRAADDTEDVTA